MDWSEAAEGFRAAPDLQSGLGQWLSWLTHERRVSDRTHEAYGRDVGQFLAFLARHQGELPRLASLTNLSRGDFRAWMASGATVRRRCPWRGP